MIRDAFRICRAPVLPFMMMGAGWGTFAAYVPEIKAGLGAGDGLFGLLLLCSSLGLLSAMWLAPILDRAFGARALPIAAACLALSFTPLGLAGSVPFFAMTMVLMGASSGLCDVVMNARVAELEAKHDRSLMNFNHAMFSFTYAVFALICSFTRDAGLPPIAVLASVTVLGLMIAPLTSGKIPVAEDESGGAGVPGGLILWGGLIVLIAFMIENAMEAWSALHIERTLGGVPAMGALGPMVLGLTMGIGRMSGHVVAGRWRDGPVLVTGAVLSAAGLAVAAAAPSPGVAYLGFGLSGLGVSVIAPIALGLVGRSATSDARTTAIARASVIGFMGFFLGPAFMGGVSELFGLRAALGILAVALLLVPVMLHFMRSASSGPRNPPAPEGYPGQGS